MKQTIYVICETRSAYVWFVGFVNGIRLKEKPLNDSILQEQEERYWKESENGGKPIKLKTDVSIDEFLLFVNIIYKFTKNKLYCQNGVFVLK